MTSDASVLYNVAAFAQRKSCPENERHSLTESSYIHTRRNSAQLGHTSSWLLAQCAPACAVTGHFRSEHYACDHPKCVEARFVAFATEQDLKQHRLREHNEQLSRNERRAAMQIPVNLNVRLHCLA